jgi:aminoglycoside phosphotransferase (APT) family kinase protein
MYSKSSNEELAVVQCMMSALGERPFVLERQALTHSGNVVYRVQLADGRSLAVRISPDIQAFSHTGSNLAALRALGLPVQTVLAQGPTPAGGSFVVLDWLPGRDIYYAFKTLNVSQAGRVAEAVVAFQHRVGEQLPAAPGGGFGWAGIGEGAPHARWTEIFGEAAPAEAFAAILERTDARPLDRFRARLGLLRASLEDYFDALRPVCFLDDLTIKNVLVDGGDLSGMIDLDTVCYGDPLMVLGSTLAHIEAEVGNSGTAYAEALLRCWAPRGVQLRATAFYACLWAVGFLSLAVDENDTARMQRLEPVVHQFLRMGETA